MAIAPSKLGSVITSVVGYRVDRPAAAALHEALTQRDLLRPDTSVGDVEAAMGRVRAEFNYADPFNSPCERLREQLRAHFTNGQMWAEPLVSLDLPDETPPNEGDDKPIRWLRRFRRRP